MTQLKAGDRVRDKRENSGDIYTVYAVYPNNMISLCLIGYEDTEGDCQESADNFELVDDIEGCLHNWNDGICKTCGAYEQQNDCEYHIFSNGVDEYVMGEAGAVERILSILEKMIVEDEMTDIRVYRADEWNEAEGIFEGENCIFSMGQFPL